MIKVRQAAAISAPRLAPAIPPPTMITSKNSLIVSAVTNSKGVPSRDKRHDQRGVYRNPASRPRRDPRVRGGDRCSHVHDFESVEPDCGAARAGLLGFDRAVAVARR